MKSIIELKGKYLIEPENSEWKPFFYSTPEMKNGLNSCQSLFEPIDNEFDGDGIDFNKTYIVEYEIKIRKITKKEREEWFKGE